MPASSGDILAAPVVETETTRGGDRQLAVVLVMVAVLEDLAIGGRSSNGYRA